MAGKPFFRVACVVALLGPLMGARLYYDSTGKSGRERARKGERVRGGLGEREREREEVGGEEGEVGEREGQTESNEMQPLTPPPPVHLYLNHGR